MIHIIYCILAKETLILI